MRAIALRVKNPNQRKQEKLKIIPVRKFCMASWQAVEEAETPVQVDTSRRQQALWEK
jgi:hypothetical protein